MIGSYSFSNRAGQPTLGLQVCVQLHKRAMAKSCMRWCMDTRTTCKRRAERKDSRMANLHVTQISPGGMSLHTAVLLPFSPLDVSITTGISSGSRCGVFTPTAQASSLCHAYPIRPASGTSAGLETLIPTTIQLHLFDKGATNRLVNSYADSTSLGRAFQNAYLLNDYVETIFWPIF
jgi:hypothetical protein